MHFCAHCADKLSSIEDRMLNFGQEDWIVAWGFFIHQSHHFVAFHGIPIPMKLLAQHFKTGFIKSSSRLIGPSLNYLPL